MNCARRCGRKQKCTAAGTHKGIVIWLLDNMVVTIWPVSVSVRYDPGSVSVDDLSAFSDLRDRRIELTDDDWLAHALYWIDAATAEEASDLAAARFSEEAQAQGLSAQPSTVSVQVHGEEGLNLLK